MGPCFDKDKRQQQQYQPIVSKKTVELDPQQIDNRQIATPRSGNPEKEVTVIQEALPSSAPTGNKTHSTSTAPQEKEIEPNGSQLTPRNRPPPVKISKLGPPQVRVEQANSKAQASLNAQKNQPTKNKQQPTPVTFTYNTVAAQPIDSRNPVTNSQNSCRVSNFSLNSSCGHLRGYQHVNLVKGPSGTENQILMEKLENSQNLDDFFRPQMQIRTSGNTIGGRTPQIQTNS